MSGTSRGSLRVWAAALLLVTGVAVLPVTHAGAAPAPITIWMDNFRYSQTDLVLDPGTTVQWKVFAGDHTATSLGTEFDSDAMDTDSDPYQHTFNRPGRYDYRCQFHWGRGMTAVIEVRDPSGATTTTELATTTTTAAPYTTTTTGSPATTATTAVSSTTVTTSATSTTATTPEPADDPGPATTVAPAPPSTRAPSPPKGSSSTTAPVSRSRAASAAPVTTATTAPAPALSTTSSSDPVSTEPPPAEATQTQDGELAAAEPRDDGKKGLDDDGSADWLIGLVAAGGLGYSLWRWLIGAK